MMLRSHYLFTFRVKYTMSHWTDSTYSGERIEQVYNHDAIQRVIAPNEQVALAHLQNEYRSDTYRNKSIMPEGDSEKCPIILMNFPY